MHRAVPLALLAALVLAGCGDDDDGDTAAGTTTSTTSTSTTTSTTATSTTTSPPTTEPTDELPDTEDSGVSELEDGRHFGFWETFEIGDTIAFGEFDLAFFLTGAEAEESAAEHGDTVENDYYIVNDNPRLRTIVAHGDTEVVVLAGDGGGPDQVETNVADFAVDRHEGSGFWITIEDGVARRIEEQFVP